MPLLGCRSAGFDALGERFRPGGGASVVWEATNALPTSIPAYKVVPKVFSTNLVSSLMELSGLGETNKAHHTGGGVLADKGVRFYRSADLTRSLAFVPSQGWVNYQNRNAVSLPGQPIEAVPSLSEALEIARRILGRIGMGKTEFALDESGVELKFIHSGREQTRRGKEKELIARYLQFRRKLGDYPVFGFGSGGGIRIGFGNQGEVSEFEMVWRDVEPIKPIGGLTPNELIKAVRGGRALVRDEIAGTPQKIRIRAVDFCYVEMPGHEQQRSFLPVAVISAMVEQASTSTDVQLFIRLGEGM